MAPRDKYDKRANKLYKKLGIPLEPSTEELTKLIPEEDEESSSDECSPTAYWEMIDA